LEQQAKDAVMATIRAERVPTRAATDKATLQLLQDMKEVQAQQVQLQQQNRQVLDTVASVLTCMSGATMSLVPPEPQGSPGKLLFLTNLFHRSLRPRICISNVSETVGLGVAGAASKHERSQIPKTRLQRVDF
jgi:hypothetical protein